MGLRKCLDRQKVVMMVSTPRAESADATRVRMVSVSSWPSSRLASPRGRRSMVVVGLAVWPGIWLFLFVVYCCRRCQIIVVLLVNRRPPWSSRDHVRRRSSDRASSPPSSSITRDGGRGYGHLSRRSNARKKKRVTSEDVGSQVEPHDEVDGWNMDVEESIYRSRDIAHSFWCIACSRVHDERVLP